MSLLITVGTTSYRAGDTPSANEVVYNGPYTFFAGTLTPSMVWDSGLNNVRQMTPAEIAVFPAQQATATAVTAKAAATASIDNGSLQAGTQFERLCVAVAQVALDAANTERAAIAAMANAVAAATNLATLQTQFAAISLPPQVTGAQLVAAVKAKIAATAQ